MHSINYTTYGHNDKKEEKTAADKGTTSKMGNKKLKLMRSNYLYKSNRQKIKSVRQSKIDL
jgi:hypothetical protein